LINFSAKNRILGSAWITVLLGLFVSSLVLLPTAAAMTAAGDPDAEAVQQAWEWAQQSSVYTFDSRIKQTSYPLPALSNVGRQPQTDTIYLAGQRDKAEDLVEMTLWQNARGSIESGMSVRSQNGRSFQRNAAGEWEEQNGLGNLVAPGGDPLTFLQTAKTITLLGADSRELGNLTFTYEKYSFELDTVAYARIMRQQLVAQMEQFGALPAGMTLETPEIYRRMTGQGELWLDETGLPSRLEITLNIPQQADRGRAVALIVTDLAGFDRAQIKAAAVPFWQSPQTWWQTHQTEVVTNTQQAAQTAVWLFVGVGLILIFFTYRRSRRFYTTIATLIIMSMLFSPLLESVQASNFQDNLQAAQTEQEARQAEAKAQADLQAEMKAELQSTDWNPNQNPLNTTAFNQPSAPALAASNTITNTTDTDNDGLLDIDEAEWHSCAFVGDFNYCDGVTDSTDSDGDGLTDGQEVNEVGTYPSLWDSDNDGITDMQEVTGFVYNGETWYLNPMEADSNNDGLADVQECPGWAFNEYTPGAICPDTDSDGTPDLFDDDNDGDGVPDRADMSPAAHGNQTFDLDSPLQLSIDNLTIDEPVFVDLQMRPIISDNLYLLNHVLDWPSNDTAGQVIRYNDSTWADTPNTAIRSSSDNAANGDMRLTPFLQVTMPYTDGHYANLPITTTAPITRVVGQAAESWLNTAELDPFGIAVDNEEIGSDTLIAYIPVTQVYDDHEQPVAFAARMLYWPQQGTNGVAEWGVNHEYRLVWMVEMITDQCPVGTDPWQALDTPPYNPLDPFGQEPWEDPGDPSKCRDQEDPKNIVDREDVKQVVHIYHDEWQLTGLDVSEERDLDLSIIYEDPAQDTEPSQLDQLWVTSWNLSNGFARGRDCDSFDANDNCVGDGQRDVTIDNMATEVSSWFGVDNYTVVESFTDYDHQAYMGYLIGTEAERILNDHFASVTGSVPTFLYAYEHEFRQLNLDDISTSEVTIAGTAISLNLEPTVVVPQRMAGMNWRPYQYVNGGWELYDVASFIDLLAYQLPGDDTFFQPEDESDVAALDAEIKVRWLQNYYAVMAYGITDLIVMDNQSLFAPDPKIPEVKYDPLVPYGFHNGALLVAMHSFAAVVGTFFTAPTLNSMDKVTRTMRMYTLGLENPDVPHVTVKEGLAFSALTAAVFFAYVAAMYFIIAGSINGNDASVRIGTIILAVVNLLVFLILLVNVIIGWVRAVTAGVSLFVNISKAISATKDVAIYGASGWVLGAGAIWGVTIFTIANQGLSGIARDLVLATAIASTIVLLIYVLLDLIGFGFVGILLGIVDAIMMLAGEETFSDMLTQAIADALYDVDLVVKNLTSSDRLQFDIEEISLETPALGFTVNNTMTWHINVTNTLKIKNGYPLDFAQKNVFIYTFQNQPLSHHDGLTADQMRDDWVVVSAISKTVGNPPITTWENVKLQTTDNDVVTIPLGSLGAGLNQESSYYLTESFLTYAEGCWTTVGGCSTDKVRDSSHINLGHSLRQDIFPATIAEFAAMDWNCAACSPRFPTQVDIDRDGLSQQTDPYPLSADGDGDTLPDIYELAMGLDPTQADGDHDGLNDAEELRYHTRPAVADTDGDGLVDGIEAKEGWLTPYGGNLIMRVWSDPLRPDADRDGLSDLDEFIFGFNPNVPTDPSVIRDFIQFDHIGVNEVDTPVALFRFEEPANSQVFADISGQNQLAVCDNSITACPTAGVNGRYGTAIQFDGVDDYVDIPFILNPGTTDFTSAVWFKVNDFSNSPFLMRQTGGSGTGRAWFTLTTDGRLYTTLGGSALYGTTAIQPNTWHHAAVSYDGTTLSLYLDGVLENQTAQIVEASTGVLWLGRHTDMNRHLAGALDELVIFDRTLPISEIDDLMNGRYNPNDRVVLPGQSLTYEATISNTHVIQDSEGYLLGNSEYISPAIATPEMVLSMDLEDYLVSFANGTGEESPFTCLLDGKCPTPLIDGGKYGNALGFDGVDDALMTRKLMDGSGNREFSLTFWLKLDQLPAAGQVMQVLDTEDSVINGVDVSVDENGRLWIEIADSTPDEYQYDATCDYTIPFLPTCSTNSSVPATTPHGSDAVLNTGWHHLSLRFAANTTDIHIDAELDSRMTYSGASVSQIGPGLLGNHLDGGRSLKGRFDNLAIYKDDVISPYWLAGIVAGDPVPLRPALFFPFDDNPVTFAGVPPFLIKTFPKWFVIISPPALVIRSRGRMNLFNSMVLMTICPF